MKENLKPCVYKLSKHYVAVQSPFEGRTTSDACVSEAFLTKKRSETSDCADHEQDRRSANGGTVLYSKRIVYSNKCDGVLFVERSGELRSLARLSTTGTEPKGYQV